MCRFITSLIVAFSAIGVALSDGKSAGAQLTADDALEIGVDAYIYAYPLVLMDLTRRVMTNSEVPDVTTGMGAPVNQFAHMPTFPDASFTQVVRPNADTLYSSLWFDVTSEPLVINVPDSGGRYYLLPMLDMWTDIFASPGKRTTGTGPQTIVITGPKWQGNLPAGAEVRRAPTGMGWMIGRTQTNGKQDYENVHKFQTGLTAKPLSAWGKAYSPPKGKVDPRQDRSPPVEQIEKMTAAAFFQRFAELTKDNPPHANDYPVMARMKQIGLEPGKSLDVANSPPQVRQALEQAVPIAQAKIKGYVKNASPHVNGWSMIASPVGTYGTDYLKRALIAYMGLGANVVEDAVYPTARLQADGQPFDSSKQYVVHFKQQQIPPVRAFWSLTMYNDKQFFADNPLSRYAIGDRDNLRFNSDGSLDLYIQRESPGKDQESNWLPAPKEGGFTMNLRLYWPKPEVLDGTWKPPAVRRVEK